MGNCLGIYVSDKMVKYAKLTNDSGSAVRVIAYGAKSHLGNKVEVIKDIITSTGSENVPVCLNVENSQVHKMEVLRQISKNDIASMIELEVLDYTKADEVSSSAVQYKYTLLDSKVSRDNAEANIIMANRLEIEKLVGNDDLQIASMYDVPYILDEIAPKGVHNYCIININDKTEMVIVQEDRIVDVQKLDFGMSQIFKDLPEILGSSQKCYEVLKSTNVYTDQENVNNPEVEKIIEPVLQDALNRIQTRFEDMKYNIDKIYLVGDIALFINSDLLFQEYFDISTEKLKPFFIDVSDVNYNLSEITEATTAFALAYEGLLVKRPDIDLIRQTKFFSRAIKPKIQVGASELNAEKNDLFSKVKSVFKSDKKSNKVRANNATLGFGFINFTKVIPAFVFIITAVVVLTISYCVATNIYTAVVDDEVEKIEQETANVNNTAKLVDVDIVKIRNNTNLYKKFVDYIDTTTSKINNGEIGRSAAYNVALFMLKVSKYIPSDVRIAAIESDSSKNVVIIAEATSYAQLGYLVSQIKFQGILENVSIMSVEHNEVGGNMRPAVDESLKNDNVVDDESLEQDNLEQPLSSSKIRATIGGVLP